MYSFQCVLTLLNLFFILGCFFIILVGLRRLKPLEGENYVIMLFVIRTIFSCAFRTFGFLSLKVSVFDDRANEVNATLVSKNTTIVSPLLNLDNDTKLYVGTMPVGKPLPASAFKSGRSFNGALDDLRFNGKAIGLWNWKVSETYWLFLRNVIACFSFLIFT